MVSGPNAMCTCGQVNHGNFKEGNSMRIISLHKYVSFEMIHHLKFKKNENYHCFQLMFGLSSQ